ncbi:MAG: hypothetical protein M3Q07_05845 [Pseudobdellovibrionaceae bacterium]|nr:hypothetical protein [Pseudobdellovibrionaceae bacterium]
MRTWLRPLILIALSQPALANEVPAPHLEIHTRSFAQPGTAFGFSYIHSELFETGVEFRNQKSWTKKQDFTPDPTDNSQGVKWIPSFGATEIQVRQISLLMKYRWYGQWQAGVKAGQGLATLRMVDQRSMANLKQDFTMTQGALVIGWGYNWTFRPFDSFALRMGFDAYYGIYKFHEKERESGRVIQGPDNPYMNHLLQNQRPDFRAIMHDELSFWYQIGVEI